MTSRLRLPVFDRPTRQFAACLLPLLLGLGFWNGCGNTETPAGRNDAAERQERGKQVVAEFLKRDASPYRKLRVRMTIVSENEPQQIYELEIWRWQKEAETLTLTHVVQPAKESDLAALSIERKGEPTVNVTYVSSSGEFRETGTNKMFFGGLTAQELLGEWEKYDYTMAAEKELDGVKVYEVEGTLKPTAESVIARSRTSFRADNYLPAEMHLSNSGGEEVRTFRVKEFRNVGGREVVWLTEIQNHVRPTKVTIEALSLDWPEKADEAMFTREHLKQIALRNN